VAWIAAALQLQPEFLAAFGFEGCPGLGTLLAMFVVPFLIGDAIKIAAATALVPTAWKLVGRDESSGTTPNAQREARGSGPLLVLQPLQGRCRPRPRAADVAASLTRRTATPAACCSYRSEDARPT
jgi:hypothetical protein